MRFWSLALFLAIVADAGSSAALAQGIRGSDYRGGGRCGPFQRIALTTPAGTCIGLVAGEADGLRMPRTLVAVGPRRFIVADLGGWSPGLGRVLDLTVANDGTPRIAVLFGGLTLPHGLAKGPDGRVYVGEAGAIWRFDPDAAKPAKDIVLDNLPADGLHNLKNLVFGRDGSLIVNHGSRSDRCAGAGSEVPQVPCPDLIGDNPSAAIWRMRFDKPGGKVIENKPLARGLRNSMGLAVHSRTGLLLQADNGLDLREEDRPPEELNIIKPGANYGWPYCTGRSLRTPGTKGAKPCSAFRAPALEMPAHAAPLGLIYYTGRMFPKLTGRWLVSWHGYRKTGHRIVSYAAAKSGAPIAPKSGQASLVVSGWDAEKDVRPEGAPVGMTQASDGSLWIAEDKNSTILVLLKQ